MAQTQTILASGIYNGLHSGGPYTVPPGTSRVQVSVSASNIPAGANFMLTGSISADGGVTWHDVVTINCPGGQVTTKQGVVQNMSVTSDMTIFLDPATQYQARYAENSDQQVTASASLTIF